MNNVKEIDTHTKKIVQVLRVQAAAEQAAMHSVKLAVARWSTQDVEIELGRALPSSSRSRWHAEAQNNFMAWLSAGGFAQQDVELEARVSVKPDAGCSCPVL